MNSLWEQEKSKLEKVLNDDTTLNELKIDENNLQQEANEQPERYAFWASMLAVANKACEEAKLKLNVLEAALYNEYQNKLAEEGSKVTDTSIKSALKTDKRWIEAKKEVIKWEYYEGKAKALEQAWKQRSQMIWIRGLIMKSDITMRNSSDII